MTHRRKHTFRPDCQGLEGRQLLTLTIHNFTNAFSQKDLSDPLGSKSEGTYMIQYSPNKSLQQEWNVITIPGLPNVVQIQNRASGLYLTDLNGDTTKGTKVRQWRWEGDQDQEWKIEHEGNTPIVVIKNVKSNLFLTDPNNSTANGTDMELYPPQGALSQEWVYSRNL